eukprot:TRINITY_DN12940_c0_g1_i1.p1 TRINITY_DN12940_c0_g1~~TRINITY_DN12940_c0_g1_i1.p1  ORF type:complete len:167 (-),score=57.19 TRINITY_DN12940_c0_g1_i1:398-898(-)
MIALLGYFAFDTWSLPSFFGDWGSSARHVFAKFATTTAWLVRDGQVALPEAMRWLGLLIGQLSVVLLVWAHVAMGASWTPFIERSTPKLVTTGPFRWTRNPMYVSMMMLGVALGLASSNVIVLMSGLLLAFAAACRVPSEETVLLELFGASYGDYMRRTRRWCPWL